MKAIVADRDAIRLENLGACCHQFLILSREAEFWYPLLLAHYDGHLPPALVGRHEHSRALLKDTVRFARNLMAREVETRAFQLPSDGCDIVETWRKSGVYTSWMQDVMNRIVQVTSQYLSKYCVFVSYGQHVYITELHEWMEHDGISQDDATIAGWITFEPSNSNPMRIYDGRQAALSDWVNGKCTQFWADSVPVRDLEADVRALVDKHDLGRNAFARILAATRGQEVSEINHGVDEEFDDYVVKMPTRNERPVATTKTLVGIYSGMFAFSGCADYTMDITFLLDGKSTRWTGYHVADV